MPYRAGTHGYLGALGALLPVPGVASQPGTEEMPASVVSTLGGRRVAFVTPAPRRGWRVSLVGQRPTEAGMLEELLRAGVGPHIWVPPYAQVTNVLTPTQSALTSGTTGGYTTAPFITSAGRARNVLAPTTAGGPITVGPAPVVGTMSVTGSAYTSGGSSATASLDWLSATGAKLGTVTGKATTGERVTVSGVAPSAAASARLTITGARAVTLPAMTWTPDALDWGAGAGCAAAIVTSWSHDVRATFAAPGAARTRTIELELTEVG